MPVISSAILWAEMDRNTRLADVLAFAAQQLAGQFRGSGMHAGWLSLARLFC